MLYKIFCISLILLLSGCGYDVPPVKRRIKNADMTASSAGFEKDSIEAGGFSLRMYRRKNVSCRASTAHLYMEGDGLSWISSRKQSSDPTPANPVALKLAVKDPHPCTIYLARPCQYIKSAKCKRTYWGNKRYSGEIVGAYQAALSVLKSRYGIARFSLFGFSGGGTIAAILAAGRSDIVHLTTVSANLDTEKWTQMHHLKPLTGSINPADLSSALRNVPQYHFIGANDSNVGKEVFDSYLERLGSSKRVHYTVVPGYSHSCCWESSWRSMLKKIR